MKKIFFIALVLLYVSGNAQEKQKEIKTSSFKVEGECGQCKNRIENAVDIKGVKLAEWDENTHILKVTYRADKTSEELIKKAILAVGHDVDGEKAPDDVYNKLPGCCQFRSTEKHIHSK